MRIVTRIALSVLVLLLANNVFAQLNLVTSADSVTCHGGSDGTARILSTTGTAPYTITWKDSTGASIVTFNNIPLPSVLPGVSASSYIIDVTDNLGVMQTDTIHVLQPDSIIISDSSVNVQCHDSTDGQIIINVTGGNMPYQYSVDNGATYSSSSTLSVDTGNYQVMILDNKNCPATGSAFTIAQPLPLLPIDSITPISCGGTADGAIKITGLGGTPPYQFSINGGTSYQTDSIFLNLNSTTAYKVAIMDSLGCETLGKDFSFDIPLIPVVNVNITRDTTSCFGVCDGAATATASGAYSPYSYQWYNSSAVAYLGGNNPTFSQLCADNNQVQVVPSNSPGANANVIETDTVFADDFSSPSWDLNTGAFGTSNLWYINSMYGTSVPAGIGSGGNYLHIGVTGGDPSYILGDSGNAEAISPLFSTVGFSNVQMSFNWISGGDTNDAFGQVWYSLDTGATWNLITGAGNDEFKNVPASSGWQSTTVTTDNLDRAFDNSPGVMVKFTWVNSPSAMGTQPPFSIDDFIITSQKTDPQVAYRICTTVGVATIHNPDTIIASAVATDETCAGNDGTITITATGGQGALQYSINNGSSFQSGSVFSNLPPNTYTVVVRDASGCTPKALGSFIVGATAPLVTSLDTTEISCGMTNDGAITINAAGGNGPLMYSINNQVSFSSTFTYTALTSGVYQVWVKDSVYDVDPANGCIKRVGSVILVNPANPTTNMSADSITCFADNDGKVSVNVTGATGPFTYQWFDNTNSAIAGANSSSMDNLSAGRYYVEVTPPLGNGAICVVRDSIDVGEPAELTAATGGSLKSTCDMDDAVISISPSGGTAPYTYTITGGFIWTPDSIFNNLGVGVYPIWVRDSRFCVTKLSSRTVTQPTDISLNTATGTDLTCFESNDGTITIDATGSNVPLRYSIDGGATYTDTSNVFTNLSAGDYTVRVIDSGNCNVTPLDITIAQPQGINILSVLPEPTTCSYASDGSVRLNVIGGSGGLEFSVDNGVTYQTENSFDSLMAGTYTLTVRDNNGCTDSSNTFDISAPDTIFATVDSSVRVKCFGYTTGEAFVSISEGGFFDYYIRSIDSSLSYIDSNNTGNFDSIPAGNYVAYVREVSNSSCLSELDTFEIEQPNSFEFSLGGDTVMCLRFDTTLFIDLTKDTNNIYVEFLWQDGDVAGTYEILDYGTYWVTVTTDSGCVYSDTITVSDDCPNQEPNIYIPKAFTPNGDALNDKLEVFHENILDFEIFIYNQWGELMFTTNDINEFWDGTYQGKPVQTGAFAYKIFYGGWRNGKLESGTLVGNVTVLY